MATHSTATPVHSFIMGVPTRWESNKFKKLQNLFRAVYIDVFDILLKLIWYIFIIRIFIQGILSFLSTQPAWSHSNKVVPLIPTHINDKA